jgi:hypothetical protein
MSVTQKFTGDTSQLMREYDKILAAQSKLEQKLVDATNAQKMAAREQMGFGSAIEKQNQRGMASIQNMAAGYIGIGGAIAGVTAGLQAYNSMLEDSKRLSMEIAEQQKATAAAQADALKNFAGLETVKKQETLDEIRKIGLRTGFADEASLISSVGAGVSAGATAKDALAAAEAAAKLTRATPSQLPTFTSAAIDLARGTGSNNPAANLGLLLQAGAQARITDPEMMAKNLAPVLAIATSSLGKDQKEEGSREAAAIFATLTKAGTDVTGQSTTTAAVQFMGRMEKFFNEPGREGAGKLPFQQIAALSADPALQQEFFKDDFGEERYKKFFKQMADSGSDLFKETEKAKAAIRLDSAEFEQQARETRSATPELMASTIDATLESQILGQRATSGEGLKSMLAERTKEMLLQNRGPDALSATMQAQSEWWSRTGARIRGATDDDAAFAQSEYFISSRTSDLTRSRDALMNSQDRSKDPAAFAAMEAKLGENIAALTAFTDELKKLRVENQASKTQKTGNAAMQSNMQAERN